MIGFGEAESRRSRKLKIVKAENSRKGKIMSEMGLVKITYLDNVHRIDVRNGTVSSWHSYSSSIAVKTLLVVVQSSQRI